MPNGGERRAPIGQMGGANAWNKDPLEASKRVQANPPWNSGYDTITEYRLERDTGAMYASIISKMADKGGDRRVDMSTHIVDDEMFGEMPRVITYKKEQITIKNLGGKDRRATY